MIECVPNFSEGRDAAKARAIVDAMASVSGVLVLGWEMDQDHNRSVITIAGPVESIEEAAVRAVGKAAEVIDLSRHQGVHPRVGAADVVPFVPLDGATMEECIDAARRAGHEIWQRFGIPVYFYESAARSETRQRLEKVRREGFDGQPPDVGEIAAHDSAGAVVVGARGFLIAFNINLATDDVAVAQAIARRVRESSGGFRYLKAMGLAIASRNCAQVSMNFTNFAETPLDLVYSAVREEAQKYGTRIHSSQLVGFVPKRAFDMAPDFFRSVGNFDESRILERRIAQLIDLK